MVWEGDLTHYRPRNFRTLIFFKLHAPVKIGNLRGLSSPEYLILTPISLKLQKTPRIYIDVRPPAPVLCFKQIYSPVGRAYIYIRGVYSLTDRQWQYPLCCNPQSGSMPSLTDRQCQYPLCCNPESGNIPSLTDRQWLSPLCCKPQSGSTYTLSCNLQSDSIPSLTDRQWPLL